MRRWLWVTWLWTGLAACGEVGPDFASDGLVGAAPLARYPTTCNGRAALCARRLDQVAMVMPHNAMSSVARQFRSPNQTHDLTTQLAMGVRALMLDVHMWAPKKGQPQAPYLCHHNCKAGAQLLTDGLSELDTFLHAQPDAVLVAIVEDYVPIPALEAALRASHLVFHLYAHPAAEDPAAPVAWPTLGEMVVRDQRMVLFSEHVTDGPPWYPYAWQYVRDTPFQNFWVRDFSCVRNRGPENAPFYLVNHWLEPRSVFRARTANARTVLANHATACFNMAQRLPNFIGVDFFEVGDVWDVVGQLEQAWEAVEAPPS